jgi:hypothetical protein
LAQASREERPNRQARVSAPLTYHRG